MKKETIRKKWRWLRHVLWTASVLLFFASIVFAIAVWTGAANPLLRRVLVSRINTLTGTRAEVRTVTVQWFSLRAVIRGLVIHGKEPADTEPLFSAEEIQAGLRIDSFWGRKVSLNDVVVKQPRLHIRVEKNGTTNIPEPPGPKSDQPMRERLFNLRISKIALQDGWILYNEVKTPLALEGDHFQLSLDAGGQLHRLLYLGNMDWQSVQFTANRYVTIPVKASAKFTLWREGFTLDQGQFGAGTSQFDVQAEMADFSDPKWHFRYRGWLDLLDIRKTFRSPLTPSGKADFNGEGTFAGGKLNGKGTYSGSQVNLTYDILHVTNLSSRGSYTFNNDGLEVPDFLAAAFGGTVRGRIAMRFATQEFRASTRVENVRLAQVLPAIEHKNFPSNALHWDTVISADTVEIWSGPLEHFQISGTSQWTPPADVAEGHIPVTGNFQFKYRYDAGLLSLDTAHIETAGSRFDISGDLGLRGSSLDVRMEAASLEPYQDFIRAVQNAGTDDFTPIRGSAKWDGKITGSWHDPLIAGHARGEHIAYGELQLDSVEGDVSYSPSELSVKRGVARVGTTQADIEATLALTRWSFLPENEWSGEVNFEKVPVSNLQQVAHLSYPIKGVLTGQFHGRGTRAEPAITGLFDLAEGEAYGISFARLRGQLNAMADEIRVANAELRIFAPGKENSHGAGIVTGTAAYRIPDKIISLELVGAGLPIENFEKLHSQRLPMAGNVTFRIKASGPVRAPQGEGTFRVVDLGIGTETIGSFDGTLNSDGREAKLELSSAMANGKVSGNIVLGLADPYPLHGKATIGNIALGPFLMSALHMEHFNGRGVADGEVSVAGDLQHPEAITLDARFTRVEMDYASVHLKNSGPIHFRTSKEEINIDPATFQGRDTNLSIQGNVRFAGRRTLSLTLNGALDLGLLGGFVPDLNASGPAQVNASIEGTMDRPRITGKINVAKASARIADFPTGLSNIQGDLIFDATRLYFENLTAEAGGGTLNLRGSVNYADRPIRFDITAQTDGVRVRYPEGMSWQVAGSLRLTGSPDGGLLSGRVMIARVNLTEGLEAAGALVSSKQGISGPSSSSTFMRNLQFDVEAVSTPDSRMEWPNAELEADAALRVRGSWDHPILLGHIHILSGELYFHGNRYRVARGDLNFARPLTIDPDINIEATTTIQQYEITLNFSGPSSKLALTYRSDPPLPANDIVTLLALGQTSFEAERSGSYSQGAGSGASALLSEAISSQLGGRLERLFGITKLRVDPGLAGVGSTGSDQNAAARITVEQQVTRDLTITYVSNVTSSQQQVIQVEYNINRNISIIALRDQNGTFGVDIKIKKRFD